MGEASPREPLERELKFAGVELAARRARLLELEADAALVTTPAVPPDRADQGPLASPPRVGPGGCKAQALLPHSRRVQCELTDPRRTVTAGDAQPDLAA